MLNNIKNFSLNPNLRYFEGEEGGGGAIDAGGEDAGGSNEGTPEQGSSLNPAWNPLLEKLPSGYHDMVAPILKDWDSNFDRRVSEVQSSYEPYKDFVEQKVDPQQLRAALEFYRLTENDPKSVYEQMGQYYGYGADQGQQGQQQEDNGDEEYGLGDDDLANNPKFKELMGNQQALAQVIMNQQEQARMADIEASIDAEVATIKTAHEGMTEDEEILMLQIATGQGITLTQAAEQLFKYKESVTQQFVQGRPSAPSVMSATNAVPGQTPIDPTKLDSKDTKNLVAQIMASRNQ